MKRIILCFFVAFIGIELVPAKVIEHIKVGELYYTFDTSQKVAVVVAQEKESEDNYISLCKIIIPSYVPYKNTEYQIIGIGEAAFHDCVKLVSVSLPNTIQLIYNFAFYNCRNLLSIDIPNSVTGIGSCAFDGCCRLKSVVIPNSVTEIYDHAFNLVPHVIYSGLAVGSPWGAKSLNGYVDGNIIYSDNTKATLLACNASMTGDILIPDGVKNIGQNAFACCDKINSIIIPNGVISIGHGAFCDCNHLHSVVIPNSVITIEGMAFLRCAELQLISIPNSVLSIGGWAFKDCDFLRELHYPSDLDLSKTGLSSSVKTIPYNRNNTSQKSSNTITEGTIIRMEKDGGVYKIPCKINGAKLKMIFDSGASSVCLSEAIAEYLYDNDYISENDFIGVGSSSVADGRIVDHLRINLRDVEIEGLHLHDVEGVVIVGQKGSLLFGQSAIQALGPVTIDGDRLIIHNGNPKLTEVETESIRNEAEAHMNSHNWFSAINLYKKLDKYGVADDYDLFSLALAYQQIDEYENSGEILKRWFESYVQNSTLLTTYKMYGLYESYYRFKEKADYHKSIDYLLKMKDMLAKLFGLNTTEYEFEKYHICLSLGHCYYMMHMYYDAKDHYTNALACYACAINVSIEEMNSPNFKNEELGKCMYYIALCEDNTSRYVDRLKDAARLGDKDAQSACNRLGISYKVSTRNNSIWRMIFGI